MKIKVNDQILVESGKDRGKTGKVLHTFAQDKKITVEGINIVKKHVKPSGSNPGGIIPQEAPMDSSNVMVICPSCNKATRVGYQVSKTGVKERVCKKCKQPLDTLVTSTK
jgi:large subunit ribosomal protein L24